MIAMVVLALAMAVFGVLGFQRGIWPEGVNLATVLSGFAVVERSPEKLMHYLNGLFGGLSLVVQAGISDLDKQDLSSLATQLDSSSGLSFLGTDPGVALAIVMGGATLVGFLIGQLLKKSRSLVGGALGMTKGYVLSASLLPWISGIAEGSLPVPWLSRSDGLVAASTSGTGTATTLTLPKVMEWLSFQDGLPLVLIIAGIAVFAVWRTRPNKVE